MKVTAEIMKQGHYGPLNTIRVIVDTVDGNDLYVERIIDVKLFNQECISFFERAFEVMKHQFLEEIHARCEIHRLNSEFAKDPEGHIKRALGTRRVKN